MNILVTSCVFMAMMAPVFCGENEIEPFLYSFERPPKPDPSESTELISQNITVPTEASKPTTLARNIPHGEIQKTPWETPIYHEDAQPRHNSSLGLSLSLKYQNANIKHIPSDCLTLEKNTVFFNRSHHALLLLSSGVNYCDREFWGGFCGMGFRKFYTMYGIGTNIYCDYLHRLTNLFRVSWGGEFFSRDVDLSWNFYMPVGKHSFDKHHHFYDGYIGDYEIHCKQARTLAKEFDITFSKNYCLASNSILEMSLGAVGLEFHCKKIFYIQGGVKFEQRDLFFIQPKFFLIRGKKLYFGVDLGLNFLSTGKGDCDYTPSFNVNRNNMMRSHKHCSYKTNY